MVADVDAAIRRDVQTLEEGVSLGEMLAEMTMREASAPGFLQMARL